MWLTPHMYLLYCKIVWLLDEFARLVSFWLSLKLPAWWVNSIRISLLSFHFITVMVPHQRALCCPGRNFAFMTESESCFLLCFRFHRDGFLETATVWPAEFWCRICLHKANYPVQAFFIIDIMTALSAWPRHDIGSDLTQCTNTFHTYSLDLQVSQTQIDPRAAWDLAQ